MFGPGEYVRFCAPPQLPGAELYSARLVDHSFAAHVHEGFSVGVIEAGVERFRYRGAEHVADAGTLVFLNPDEPHTGQAEVAAGWRYHMLYLEPPLVRTLVGGDCHFATATVRDAALAHAFLSTLPALWQAAEPLAFQSRVAGLLQTAARRHGGLASRAGAAVGRRRFARVADYIEAHLEEPLQLPTLAALAELSLAHFVRAFTAEYHLSPHRYVQARRLARAKRLLAAAMPPAQAASAAGLTDQSHLTRWFRQAYGVTPARYQEQIRTRPAPGCRA